MTPEYRAVAAFYEGRAAKRSGVPYMVHIDEGLVILKRIGASEAAARAFCLHPLAQSDVPFESRDPHVVELVKEYRRVASAVERSEMAEVNDMLIADKVQNYKDFLRYHRETHPRADELDRYFTNWLDLLGVSGAALEAHFAALG